MGNKSYDPRMMGYSPVIGKRTLFSLNVWFYFSSAGDPGLPQDHWDTRGGVQTVEVSS
jgi:hypothetical protein